MINKNYKDVEYFVHEEVAGIIDGEKYEIEDTEKTFREWKKLQNDFVSEFGEFSEEEPEDYELPEWHHETKCLYVYLYNEKFYNKEFIPRILQIVNDNGNCFAQFECYDDNLGLLGDFQVYKDIVVFSKLFEKSGTIKKLCDISSNK